MWVPLLANPIAHDFDHWFGPQDDPGCLLLRLGLCRNRDLQDEMVWNNDVIHLPMQDDATEEEKKIAGRDDHDPGRHQDLSIGGKRWLPFPNPTETLPFTLLVHIYSARRLPPADENGVLDPYVVLRQLGEDPQTKRAGWKTPHENETTSPQWRTSLALGPRCSGSR